MVAVAAALLAFPSLTTTVIVRAVVSGSWLVLS
jgi:hypothetical protein